MTAVIQYRKRASEMLRMAGLAEDDSARVAYEGLARTFLLLADEADARNILNHAPRGKP